MSFHVRLFLQIGRWVHIKFFIESTYHVYIRTFSNFGATYIFCNFSFIYFHHLFLSLQILCQYSLMWSFCQSRANDHVTILTVLTLSYKFSHRSTKILFSLKWLRPCTESNFVQFATKCIMYKTLVVAVSGMFGKTLYNVFLQLPGLCLTSLMHIQT